LIVFLHQLGRLFCLRYRTSSQWGLLVIRPGSRGCRWESQVGLRRDLGMTRELTMNIERKFFFSLTYGFMACFFDANLFIYSELRELRQRYQALVLDVHCNLRSNDDCAAATNDLDWVFLQSECEDAREVEYQSYRGRGFPTTATASSTRKMVVAIQRTEACVLHSQLLNSKYRISWKGAEMLIELAGGGDGGASTAASWGVASPLPLEFPPHPSEIMGGAGAADLVWEGRGAGKERSRLWGMKRNPRLRRSRLRFLRL
jgi:hypothetical protein